MDKEAKAKYNREWYLKHREITIVRSQNWRTEHREERRQSSATYKQNHKEIVAEQYRRSKEKAFMRSYANRYIKPIIIKERGNTCEICKSVGRLELHHKEYTQSNSKDCRDVDKEKIMLLCNKCHNRIHRREKKQNDISV